MYKLNIRSQDLKALQAFLAGKKESREALKALHITPEYIEATDGCALLRIGREMAPGDMPAGVYTIASVKKIGAGISEVILDVLDAQYPATDNVIPKLAHVSGIAIAFPVLDDDMSITRAVVKLFQHTGNAYAYGMIERLAGLTGSWTTEKAVTDKAARLDYTDAAGVTYIAVIMPLSMKD